MKKLITARYTLNNVGVTGLTVTVTIRNVTDKKYVVENVACKEDVGGIYYFELGTWYRPQNTYFWEFDAGTDDVDTRYLSETNGNFTLDIDDYLTEIHGAGRWGAGGHIGKPLSIDEIWGYKEGDKTMKEYLMDRQYVEMLLNRIDSLPKPEKTDLTPFDSKIEVLFSLLKGLKMQKVPTYKKEIEMLQKTISSLSDKIEKKEYNISSGVSREVKESLKTFYFLLQKIILTK
jgi:hypothetical protein